MRPERIPADIVKQDEGELVNLASEAYHSLDSQIGTLLKANDLPEQVQEELRKASILSTTDLEPLISATARGIERSVTQTSYMPSPEEKQALLRNQIAKEILHRMTLYLRYEYPLSQPAGEDTSDWEVGNFLQAAERLLVTHKQ